MASAATSGGHPSEVVQALKEVCLRIHDVLPTLEYAVRHSASASPAVTDVPVFRGFEDDPVHWVQLVDALAARHAWPEHLKRSFAVERLRDAARAWHLYAGHSHSTWASWSGSLIAAFGDLPGTYDDRFMKMRARRQGPGEDITVYIHDKLSLLVDCDLTWVSPVARQYVIDGLADPIHAAVLTVQSSQLSLQAFIHLAAELQQTATRQAQELYLQASEQPLPETAGPKPEHSGVVTKDEGVTSKTAPTVNEDDVPRPKSPDQACNRPMVSFVQAQSSLVSESPSTNEENSPERHQVTCAQLGGINVRSNADRSALSLSASKALLEQRPDVLKLAPITLSKRIEGGAYHFADVKTPATSTQESVGPGKPLGYLNSSELTAEHHIPFTITCDMATVPAQPDEAEHKDMPLEASHQAASSIQTDYEKRVEHSDSPIADKDLSATVVEAVSDKRREGKDAEEKMQPLRKENDDQVDRNDNTTLTQCGCKDTMPRVFDAQYMNVAEDTVASSSMKESLALTQATKEKINRMTRHAQREETYHDFFSCSCADCRARAKGLPQHFRSVAECEDAKSYEVKAPSAAGGQSTTKETRTAADWKRRKKKR